jgi:hypothetical protein
MSRNKTAATPKKGMARLFEIAGDHKGLVGFSGFLSVLASVASFVPYLAVYFLIREIVAIFPNFSDLNGVRMMGYGIMALLHDEQSFIAKAGDRVKSVFLKIAEPIPECELNYFRLQVTELLFLLMCLKKPAESERRSFFATDQVNIAKQVMNIITRDLSAHHRIDTLTRDFCVSPTSLTP